MTPTNGFLPSAYQRGIFRFLAYEQGDGIVTAVAGSGKTTTLTRAARLINALGGSAIFLAFNKHIAETLGERLAGTTMVARTIHSVGFECVSKYIKSLGRKVRVRGRKYPGLISAYLESHEQEFKDRGASFNALRKLCDFVRLTLTDVHDRAAVIAMCDRYNLVWDERYYAPLKELLSVGDRNAETAGEIDYTDMLYLCHKHGLVPDKFAWVLVDECQDLNAAQLALVLKMREPGGRMLFVGDPAQAIMMFAGADARSYWRIQELTGARELPLSVCYRCPRSHVELARTLVPHIEARPGAPEGEIVNDKADDELPDLVAEGDLILCRRNAPLIKHCLRLIRRKRAARVRGRDVGKELAETVIDLGAKLTDFSRFPSAVESWAGVQRDRLEQRKASAQQFEKLDDMVECLINCYEGFEEAKSAAELAKCIEGLFSDESAAIWLSSVHRAKGLENRRVFVVESATLGQPRSNQSDEEVQQEKNLQYVAYTRAIETLYLM